MAKESYFWNIKGENFAGKSFGEEVTNILEGQTERTKVLLGLGKIVTSEPVDFNQAKESELNSLRAEAGRLQFRNEELEAQLKKSASAKLKEAKDKIKDLEAQLEEATAPKKDK